MNKSLLELLKAEDLALCGFQSKRDLEDDAKSEWLTMEQIEEYEKEMLA